MAGSRDGQCARLGVAAGWWQLALRNDRVGRGLAVAAGRGEAAFGMDEATCPRTFPV